MRLVLQEIARVMGSPTAIRALGFCVSVEHARFMARRFTEAGVESVAVTGDSSREARESAIRRLEKGELKVLFTVDLFNEGVDVPSVDTVLFLRPTESATVFLQQLGRGLRLHESKACLTVLDFMATPTPTSASTCATGRQLALAASCVWTGVRGENPQGKRCLARELHVLGPEVSWRSSWSRRARSRWTCPIGGSQQSDFGGGTSDQGWPEPRNHRAFGWRRLPYRPPMRPEGVRRWWPHRAL